MRAPADPDTLVRRFADLIVRVGLRVREGQVVQISTEVGKEQVTRAVADAAYRRGALFVDPWYFDPLVKRSRLQHCREATLGWVPPWYGARVEALGRLAGARVSLTGPTGDDAAHGVEPMRAGLDLLPSLAETRAVVNERTTTWTVVPAPNLGWARVRYPGREDDDALRRLWHDIAYVCRLDAPDPELAWKERLDELDRRAAVLRGLRLDAIRFEGDGMDLTVGLLEGSWWTSARHSTVAGVVHTANLPTEEVLVAPDPARCDGHITLTRQLALRGAIVPAGTSVHFASGRLVEVRGGPASEALRALAAHDEGASRLGEVALVDGSSRIASAEAPFFDTLLDENAACHVALGNAYSFTARGESALRINRSAIHVDLVFGAPGVSASGIMRDGARVQLLVAGEWCI